MGQQFMVTGSTGYQGGSLTRELIAQGHTVHALVRDPNSEKGKAVKKLGAVIFEGGFDDKEVIKAALKDCNGVFLNPFPTPLEPDLQVRHAKNIIDSAVEQQCHLLMSSAVFTDRVEKWRGSGPEDFLYLYYSRKHQIEAEVRAAKLKSYTIIRPPYLMHNYLLPFCNFHYPELHTEGVMKHMYGPDRRFAHLDSADMGKLAAVVLQEPDKFSGLELDVAAENLNAEDAAEVIRKVSGNHTIRTEKVHIPNFDTRTKTGLTWHFFANTQDVELANTAEMEKLFGVKLTTFAQYLEREKELLMRTLPVPK